jgi:benzaldehyde dehydrogenase (NAD)
MLAIWRAPYDDGVELAADAMRVIQRGFLGIRAVAPALALGNAVLLKPDPRTIITGGVSMVRIFEEAGLPAGLLQLVPGGADVGEAMVADPRVRVIAFTGSTRAGRAVGELAGRHLTRAHLELGGNSAYVIRADADVDKAVNLATWGSFLHQGQICMTVGRHIVHESIFDEYVDKLAAKADSMHVGDPAAGQVHLGPLIDEVQRDRVHALVQDAVAQGAELRAGGAYEELFYRPTVLANTPRDAAAYCDESSAPWHPPSPSPPTPKPSPSRRRPSTGWRSASSPPTCSPVSTWPSGSPPESCTSTTRQ